MSPSGPSQLSRATKVFPFTGLNRRLTTDAFLQVPPSKKGPKQPRFQTPPGRQYGGALRARRKYLGCEQATACVAESYDMYRAS